METPTSQSRRKVCVCVCVCVWICELSLYFSLSAEGETLSLVDPNGLEPCRLMRSSFIVVGPESSDYFAQTSIRVCNP